MIRSVFGRPVALCCGATLCPSDVEISIGLGSRQAIPAVVVRFGAWGKYGEDDAAESST